MQQIADKREAISFLEKLAEKVKNNTEAHALCQVRIITIIMVILNIVSVNIGTLNIDWI